MNIQHIHTNTYGWVWMSTNILQYTFIYYMFAAQASHTHSLFKCLAPCCSVRSIWAPDEVSLPRTHGGLTRTRCHMRCWSCPTSWGSPWLNPWQQLVGKRWPSDENHPTVSAATASREIQRLIFKILEVFWLFRKVISYGKTGRVGGWRSKKSYGNLCLPRNNLRPMDASNVPNGFSIASRAKCPFLKGLLMRR